MKLVLLSLSLSAVAHAGGAPDAVKSAFCSRAPGDVQRAALDPSSRIAFQNYGGIGNGGVCWWHSRMQRASLYLAVFRPDQARPTEAQAKKILASLAAMKVTEIPGYSNFYDFTNDFSKDTEKRLDEWQLIDGILHFRWIDGLTGATRLPSLQMQAKMDDLYQRVVVGKQVILDKLQMPGIDAHAWLVLDMTKTDTGYTLHIIDSNLPDQTTDISYTLGDTYLTLPYGFTFVPYVDYSGDLTKIASSVAKYCR
jgi:hypothetical protein